MHQFFCFLLRLPFNNRSRRRHQQPKCFYTQTVYIISRKHPLQTGNESHNGHKLVLGIYLNKLHRLVTSVSLHQAYSLRISCENKLTQNEIKIKQKNNHVQHRELLFSHHFEIIRCIYILYVYTSVTFSKIRYVTVDAQLYTQGENKTQKSCTVLIEGKDTHDC